MAPRYALLLAGLLVLSPSALAQTPGSCTLGDATAELSLSDVRARLYNSGGLFWRGGDALYEVPKGGGVGAIFTAGLWLGGTVGGDVRTAWADYGDFEFWPGPLDDGATLPDPDDCSAFDRIYRVTAPELAAFEAGGAPSAALAEWPVGLGAPAVDAGGDPVVPTSREQTVDLEAGERPVVYGSETAFWVMNDVGNVHARSGTAPLGVEVRVSAFAINDPAETVLDQATFYRYEIVNRSDARIDDLRVGFWIDSDLGNFQDDYIGTDPNRSLFYTYNGDSNDEVSSGGYGTAPPALGVDLLSGGAYGMTYASSADIVNGDPQNGVEVYNYLSGRWRNGQRWTYGFDATAPSQPPTDWFFDTDPTAADPYWSERDTDPAPGLQPNTQSDRRGLVSSFPVSLAPGASHTVDVGLVFAQGADYLGSVTELFAASDLVQARYDDGSLFEATSGDLGPPPATAPALLSPADGTVFTPPERVVLDWTPVADAEGYRIEFADNAAFTGVRTQDVAAPPANVDFSELPMGTDEPIYWRVSGVNPSGAGPSSEARAFTYAFTFTAGVQQLSNDQFAFLEVVGPGGADPCGGDAGSTFGCAEAGGNAVYMPNRSTPIDANGTGAYGLSSLGAGPEQTLAPFAPNDYEIRFTAAGSIAYHLFNDGPGDETHRVPFELWDLGVVPLGAGGVPAPNDPSDDVRLVPIVFSDGGAGLCRFEFGQVAATNPSNPYGVPLTDRIYAYYPATTYADFEATAAPLVDAAPEGCYDDAAAGVLPELIDVERGRPLQRVVLADLTGSGSVADLAGTVIRFHTTNPEPVSDEAGPEASALTLAVVPNPSRGAATVRFATEAPGAVRVRVLDVLGREVAVVADGERRAGAHTLALPGGLAAGVYVVAVEAGGERRAQTFTVVR